MNTRALVCNLCKKYDTCDPLEIARQRNIIVKFERLGSVYGYYSKSLHQQFIHVNQDLAESVALLTACHELGHSIMHPDLNTPFLRAATFFSVDRLETEANCFAVDLAYPDNRLWDYLSRPITDAAEYMGVTTQLAEYRMKSVHPVLWTEFD